MGKADWLTTQPPISDNLDATGMRYTVAVARFNVDVIWTKNGQYRRDDYASEADLESSILLVQAELFGINRVYLPVKKKIGAKGGQRNIPDGYLIDLGGPKPRLYVVENELESHDPLRHIAVQILQFSLSFESERILVKKVLPNALKDRPGVTLQPNTRDEP